MVKLHIWVKKKNHLRIDYSEINPDPFAIRQEPLKVSSLETTQISTAFRWLRKQATAAAEKLSEFYRASNWWGTDASSELKITIFDSIEV